jgi:hypothetical protein
VRPEGLCQLNNRYDDFGHMHLYLQASSMLQLSVAFAHFTSLVINYLQLLLNMFTVVNILCLISELRSMLRSLELFLLGPAARPTSA